MPPFAALTMVYGDITLKARWKKAEDQTPSDNGNSTPTVTPAANRSGAVSSAATGDSSPVPAFTALASAAAAGVVGVTVSRRKKKN